MRALMIAVVVFFGFMAVAGFVTTSNFKVSAQDQEVTTDEPVIDEPEVGVETPDSKLPEDLEPSPLPQWWQGIAGLVSAGLTALFIRWTPKAVERDLGAEKWTDVKRFYGIVAAVVVGVIGAWLADTLAFDKVTLSAILYTAVAGWLSREVIPGTKAVTHSIEGK